MWGKPEFPRQRAALRFWWPQVRLSERIADGVWQLVASLQLRADLHASIECHLSDANRNRPMYQTRVFWWYCLVHQSTRWLEQFHNYGKNIEGRCFVRRVSKQALRIALTVLSVTHASTFNIYIHHPTCACHQLQQGTHMINDSYRIRTVHTVHVCTVRMCCIYTLYGIPYMYLLEMWTISVHTSVTMSG